MKKIFSLLFIIPLLFVSCNSYLDTPPDDRIDLDEKNEKSAENIRKLLVSAYPNRSHWMLAEYSSDNVDLNVKSDWETYQAMEDQIFNWEDITEKSWESPQWIWDACYSAIATANQALEAIENMGSPAELNPHKGEALMCRAYGHFILVNLFAKSYGASSANDLGLVYMTAPETQVKPEYKRESVKAVYDKINADIEEALPLIDDALYQVPQYHFNKRASLAFATRFNLYYRKYDKTIEYATQLLGSDAKTSLRNWQALSTLDANDMYRPDAYMKDEKASLLVIPCNSLYARVFGPYYFAQKYAHNRTISNTETLQASCPWGSVYSISYCNANTYSNQISKVLLQIYGEYDEVVDPVSGTVTPYFVEIPFTTDEALLCRAEAYILKQTPDTTAALKDLNTFVSNFTKIKTPKTGKSIIEFYKNIAYYTPLNPTVKKQLHPDFEFVDANQENLIHAVLQLRRILNIHSGLRWYDVKRYGIEIQRRRVQDNTVTLVGNTLTPNDPRKAIQLPQDVINAGLEANPR